MIPQPHNRAAVRVVAAENEADAAISHPQVLLAVGYDSLQPRHQVQGLAGYVFWAISGTDYGYIREYVEEYSSSIALRRKKYHQRRAQDLRTSISADVLSEGHLIKAFCLQLQ